MTASLDTEALYGATEFRSTPAGMDITNDGKTLSGYFTKWGEWTALRSGVLESFAPGSLNKAIEGNNMRVFFEHGQDPQFGRKPIAIIRSIVDDGIGAKYEAELLDASYVADLMPGLRAGLYGASVGFYPGNSDMQVNRRPVKSERNLKGMPEVTVTSADAFEFSLTALPSYKGTSASVRSIQDVTPKADVAQPANRPAVTKHANKEWYL